MQRKRLYGCANDFLKVDRTEIINTRGCRNVMYSWYRSGFAENIVMAIIGIGIAAFEFYLYSLNRRQYFNLLDEYDEMRKPMMNATMSMSTINSKGSQPPQQGQMINFGPQPIRMPMRLMNPAQQNESGGSRNNLLPQVSASNQNFVNPLQAIQNAGRFGVNRASNVFNQVSNNPPSDRVPINASDISQN